MRPVAPRLMQAFGGRPTRVAALAQAKGGRAEGQRREAQPSRGGHNGCATLPEGRAVQQAGVGEEGVDAGTTEPAAYCVRAGERILRHRRRHGWPVQCWRRAGLRRLRHPCRCPVPCRLLFSGVDGTRRSQWRKAQPCLARRHAGGGDRWQQRLHKLESPDCTQQQVLRAGGRRWAA